MKFGVLPVTNEIVVGTTRKDTTGHEVWTKRTEVTQEVLSTVFEYMRNLALKSNGMAGLRMENVGTLTLILDQKKEEKGE